MSVINSMDPAHDAVQQEAADWFAKRRDGARTAKEEAAFESWRRQSKAHARAYAETERAWIQWEGLQRSARVREMTAAAVAATAQYRRRATRSRWQMLLAAASLAAIIVLGDIWLLPLMMHASPPAVYSTGLGEQRTEQLPDGTRIVLNSQTTLEVHYGREQREVTLRHGEALFEVVHDAQHPFIVTTTEGTVTDLGTQFDVRNDDGVATVTLLQGRVEVATQGEHKQLVAGEQVRYGASVPGIHVSRVDHAVAVTSWIHARLDFDGLPLAQAVAEANRYSSVKLRLGDPRLADLPVGGSFRAGDNAGIAAAFSAVFPVRVARKDAHEILLMPR